MAKGRDWTLVSVLLDHLKTIREIGYSSDVTRTNETVLACIRIAEEGIREIEESGYPEDAHGRTRNG
jgi:hypothetical protein